MNTTLSETAQAAIKRVQALRTFTQKTGFQTIAEQSKLLLALDTADLLAVADVLGSETSHSRTAPIYSGPRRPAVPTTSAKVEVK